jgi:nucleoside-diphosphate-sugar epimerase
MTTLVTGGNGWVPSHIVRRLARRGESVVSYDLMEPDTYLLDFLGSDANRVVFERGDVTDHYRLGETASRHGVTSIVHAAAITPRISRERQEPTRVIDVNLGGTIKVLEVARALPNFRRMIYVSSCAVWGDHPGETELTEAAPSHATSLYGITKHTGERICRRYATLFGLDVVSMRPANVYGPMERVTPGYVGATEPREMLRIHAAGNPILVNSLEGPYLDWTFVEDIAEGIELGWTAESLKHDVYSITCGRLYSIGDLLAAFKRHVPDLDYREVPAHMANYTVSGNPPGPVPSNARMAADFGWTPPTSFDEGMWIYLDWIKANGPQ